MQSQCTCGLVALPKQLSIFHPATVFVKLKKPNAAIRDADAALQVGVHTLVGDSALLVRIALA